MGGTAFVATANRESNQDQNQIRQADLSSLDGAESRDMLLSVLNVFHAAYDASTTEAPATNATRLLRITDMVGRVVDVCIHLRRGSLCKERSIVSVSAQSNGTAR